MDNQDLLSCADRLHDEGKYSESLKIYRKLALRGIEEAQFRLGNAYIFAEGVECNLASALKWLSESAQKGLGKAIYLQAKLYDPNNIWNNNEIEEKIEESEKIAKEKYKQAFDALTKNSNEGDAEAMYLLAQCYQCGNGVAKSEEAFFEWNRKAFEHGFSFAANELLSIHLNKDGPEYNLSKAKYYFDDAKSKGVLCVVYPKEFDQES